MKAHSIGNKNLMISSICYLLFTCANSARRHSYLSSEYLLQVWTWVTSAMLRKDFLAKLFGHRFTITLQFVLDDIPIFQVSIPTKLGTSDHKLQNLLPMEVKIFKFLIPCNANINCFWKPLQKILHK
ncbi:hypothetical protein K1719_025902 [Acacia pycnantha]|nr:hypothetical protein K1719_025902 [Acacia pycnantha]